MIAYKDFVALSRSNDSAERGQAAHYAASAYIAHHGPADEHAALYASLMGFLDDPSVKVRAALAYGLLHSERAPRPVMLSLLHDAAIIGRAVAQYSPVLLDTDLVVVLRNGDGQFAGAIAARKTIGQATLGSLLAIGDRAVTLAILSRTDLRLGTSHLSGLIAAAADDAEMRGALLARTDLPARLRLLLVDQVREALRTARIVAGAIAPRRLERLLRDARDTAIVSIGEREVSAGAKDFVQELVANDRVSTRLLLHALVCGRVEFYSACSAQLAEMPKAKVYSILERGSRSTLAALFVRCGMAGPTLDLMVRLVLHARNADLADDLSARYLVVSVLIEELIIEHDGNIPESLTESFAYLNEQNISLARQAARGVMVSFAGSSDHDRKLPIPMSESRALLPAA